MSYVSKFDPPPPRSTHSTPSAPTVSHSYSSDSHPLCCARQIGAAIAVLICSTLGLPVSTSHCLVGAVVGVGGY